MDDFYKKVHLTEEQKSVEAANKKELLNLNETLQKDMWIGDHRLWGLVLRVVLIPQEVLNPKPRTPKPIVRPISS